MGSFANAHDSARLTAATFDAQQRRLVTGGSDGSVHIWSALTAVKSGTLAWHERVASADAPPACRDMHVLTT